MATVLRAMKLWVFASLAVAGPAVAAGCSSAEATSTFDEEQTESPCIGTSSLALRTCASGPTLPGIDVSSYQGVVDFKKVKAAGAMFAFVRVSAGVVRPDARFGQNWKAMKSAGLFRGLYQYFHPAADVDAQVNLLISKVAAAGGLEPGDLPPVLDLETDNGLPASVVVGRAKAWIARVEARYGVKPIIYTAPFFSSVIGKNFAGYTLWVANYGATCPLMPSGWTDWHFWQTSESGEIDGVSTPVDTNLFNGTLSELTALTVKTVLPAVDVPIEPMNDEIVVGPPEEDQGETIGSSVPKTPPPPATYDPCR